MREIACLVSKVGVETITPEEVADLSQLKRLGCAAYMVPLGQVSSLDGMISAAEKSLGCSDGIRNADDFFDKIVDLYWIDRERKPVIIFDGFQRMVERLDADDRRVTSDLFRHLDEFWKNGPLPYYSQHAQCLYLLSG